MRISPFTSYVAKLNIKPVKSEISKTPNYQEKDSVHISFGAVAINGENPNLKLNTRLLRETENLVTPDNNKYYTDGSLVFIPGKEESTIKFRDPKIGPASVSYDRNGKVTDFTTINNDKPITTSTIGVIEGKINQVNESLKDGSMQAHSKSRLRTYPS